MSNNTNNNDPMIPCPIVGEVCDHPETVDCSTCKRLQRRGDQTEEPSTITILENGVYRGTVYNVPVTIGKAFNGVADFKKEGQYLQNWEAKDLTIEDLARVVIADSTINNLNIRGFCILKNCIVDRVRVSMFGNVFIVEGNEIQELDISGTVHTISSASKVDHINLHHGGRIRLTTKDYQLGKPPQPKNIRMDGDREWYGSVLTCITHPGGERTAEYWAFG